MRNILFNEPQTDSWNEWKDKCQKETKKLTDNWKPDNKFKIKEKLYKEHKGFYFAKNGPFRGKCAYCQTELNKLDHLDHYRPKKLVTNENDKPIEVTFNNKRINHPGYYWLAYSWDNLLPACNVCNSPSKENDKSIGKRNRFPVIGKHAFKPGYEKNEKPKLLNPVNDHIEEHIKWDNEKKMIVAKPGSQKGKVTIEILGFHQREQLMEDWVKAYDDVFKSIVSFLSTVVQDKQKRINNYKKEIYEGCIPYSFVAQAALKEIEELVRN